MILDLAEVMCRKMMEDPDYLEKYAVSNWIFLKAFL